MTPKAVPKTTVKKKLPEDFALEAPSYSSLQEFLVEELFELNIERMNQSRPAEHYSDADVASLLKRLYAHIEMESLRLYHSSDPWAIQEYIVQHILNNQPGGSPLYHTRSLYRIQREGEEHELTVEKAELVRGDTILEVTDVDHATTEDEQKAAEKLAEPLLRWQQQGFDPISHFRTKLEAAGRKRAYIKEVTRPAVWFVSQAGRKRRYSEDEIVRFFTWLRLKYEQRDARGKLIREAAEISTWVLRMREFYLFLNSLPEDEFGRKQTIPFVLPSYVEEANRPMFSPDAIAKMIYEALMKEQPEVVLRLALATIYGARCGEVAAMDSERIDLDAMTLKIPTQKRGSRKPQPLLESLAPLFYAPLHKTTNFQVIRELKRICRRAQVSCGSGTGVHAIRRAVVTNLLNCQELKEIPIKRFMRWSMGRGLGAMPTYYKTPTDETDRQVLAVHPFVKVWEDMLCFLPYLPQWSQVLENEGLKLRYYNIA